LLSCPFWDNLFEKGRIVHLTFSNRFDSLFEHFAKSYRQRPPFEQHLVLVPSFATQFYIKKRLAEDLGIFMGVEFSFLQPGIKHLIALFFPEVELKSQLDLALQLEKIIKNLLNRFEILSNLEKNCFEPLLNYLESSTGKIDPKRFTSLADSLATLFFKYGLYTESIEPDWEKKETFFWQQALWKQVSLEPSFLTHPQKVLDLEPKSSDAPINLYLFGFSFVPKLYYQILQKLDPFLNIHILQLSPCRLFWTDIRNPFEKTSMIAFLKRKGAKKGELETLSSYLSETNLLLSSLGKLGRNWFQTLEESDPSHIEEDYVIPKAALELKPYQEYHEGLENNLSNEKMTLLKHVQMDLLSLRKPEEVISLDNDFSIQLHRASTYQREVEVLYNHLHDLFEKKSDLSMQDVVILVPEIEKYIPYIESMFGSKESPFDYLIHDYPFTIRNSLLKGFYSLIDLVGSRWDSKTLFQLLEHPLFQKRFRLSKEQTLDWKNWVEEVNVQWGFDKKHQEQVLKKEYGEEESSFNSEAASWADFYKRIVDLLAREQLDSPFDHHLNRLNFSDTASLNTFLELIDRLRKDLEPLEDQTVATFEEWSTYLASILQAYFGQDYEDSLEITALTQRIRMLSKLSGQLKEDTFPFMTFWHYLKKDLSVFHTELYSQQLEVLSFYSLFSKPTLPAKVVYVLGFNDETFPRNPLDEPLEELKSFTQTNYCPKTIDSDRYQFLELLLLAKEALYFSYLGICPKTHKEQLPSLLITELLSYLDRHYLVNLSKPSLKVKKDHPHLSFDAHYFRTSSQHIASYSLAQSYYQPAKKKALSELTESFNQIKSLRTSLKSLNNVQTLSIQKLLSFVRNPMQAVMNQRYQIYLRDDKWENPNQNYALSSLQKSILRKQQFNGKDPLSHTDSLPRGVFKEVVESHLDEEIQNRDAFLKKLGIKKEEVFFIELREDIETPLQLSQQHWLIPSLKVKLSTHRIIHITGILEQVTEKGLLSLSRSCFENVWCLWPSLLILDQLPNLFKEPFQTALHFISSEKSFVYQIQNSIEELKKMVTFYLMSHQEFCPYLPEWLPFFVRKTREELKEKMRKDLQSPHFYNLYARSLLQSKELPEDTQLDTWQSLSQELFSESFKSIGSGGK